MLKFAKIAAVVGCSLLAAGQANAAIEDELQNICTIVKADDKGELRKKMKKVQSNYKIKLKDYYDAVSCGGNSLIRTAMINNAVEAGTLLVKKMPKSRLADAEDDGKTLLNWAQENGFADSPVTEALTKRI